MDPFQAERSGCQVMRKCIEIVVQGLRLRGVVHLPPAGESTAASGFNGLGVIILHPGFLPRSAQGDFAVALGDTLARKGIQTIRIDMPGLGDSEGDLPEDSFTFIDTVQEGGLADAACECMDRIKDQLGLQRVIIGGHCGGAITGFFALAKRKRSWLVGLFALDVIFHSVRPVQAPVKSADGRVVRESLSLRREVLRNEIRMALLNTPLGGGLQKLVQRTRDYLRPRRSNGAPRPARSSSESAGHEPGSGELPPEANSKLVECIGQVLRSGLPLLFVTADDPTKQSGFDYTEHLLSRCGGRASRKRIAGTDHGFVSGGGKTRASECVAEWIAGEFRNPSSPQMTAPRV